MRTIYELVKDQRGATAVEYGLILALIFLAMVAAVQAFANGTIALWDYVVTTTAGT